MSKSYKTNVMQAVFHGRESDLSGSEKLKFRRMFTRSEYGTKLSASTEVKDFDFNGDFASGFRYGNNRKFKSGMKVLKRKSDRAKSKRFDLD